MKFRFSCYTFLLLTFFSLAASAQEVPDSLNVLSPPQRNSQMQYSEANLQQFELILEEMEEASRIEWQNPDKVIELLGSLHGKTVGDIGAGSGYFTFRMARHAEKVIAIDVDFRFLDYIEDKKSEINQQLACSIETRLAEPHDANLDPQEVDVILLVNTYPFIRNRIEYFKKIRKALRKDGFMMIVSFKKGQLPVGPDEQFKLSSLQVADELKKAGFGIEFIDNVSLPYQYIVKAKL